MCFRVNNFLCCLSLRTGGLVIGWVTLIANIIASIVTVIALIAALLLSCEDFKEFLEGQGAEISENYDETCGVFKGVYAVVAGFVLIFFLVIALFGYLCISGTLNRQPCKIKPVMCLLGVEVIFCVIGLIFHLASYGLASAPALVTGILYICFYGYLFACLYSLISKIQEENGRGYVYATSA